LRCTAGDFAEVAPGTLRFCLTGQAQYASALYELLLNNTLRVTLANSPEDRRPVLLGADALRPVGFEPDEGLLPYPARSFLGYRLLSEFFAFPQKFLFFDLTGLDAKALAHTGHRLEVFVYFDRANPELEHHVTGDTFALGCTPMVNLYHQRAEPIPLTHAEVEYRIVPDARRPEANEVYSVDRVTVTDSAGHERAYLPIYGLQHGQDPLEARHFWYATRRPAGHGDKATEVFLSLVDLGFKPSAAGGEYVSVETTCLSRDLPSRLPFGGGQPRLQLGEGNAPLSRIVCLTAPTPTRRPPLGQGALWRLISHLTLNHLSITDGEQGTRALQEILALYDFAESDETRAVIEGIAEVRSRPVNARAPTGGPGSFCRGTEVSIEFDETYYAGSSVFLFASVLERFLALYCSLNSFTRLNASVKGRGTLRKWPPRAGTLRLL
jgi:type VI secretion system protein ImpG